MKTAPRHSDSRRIRFYALAGGIVVAALILWHARQPPPHTGPRIMPAWAPPNVPSKMAVWPWPGATHDVTHKGVDHWFATDVEGATLDLLRFDFDANPALRFELYSQDEDDAKPYDNIVKYFDMAAGQATRHLNERFAAQHRGQVVAAWNGPFFGYYHTGIDAEETVFHLSPVVLHGQVRYTAQNFRWSFGVKYEKDARGIERPRFNVFYRPGQKLLTKEFDFAGGGVQCLLKDGKPMHLQSVPKPGEAFQKQPAPSGPCDVGHIPSFDHANLSRMSIAWSRDQRRLYLLEVNQAESEGASLAALREGREQSGGWTVADIQRFWLSMQQRGLVWSAINSDAGDVAQLAYRLPDKNYRLIIARCGRPTPNRLTFSPSFDDAPHGGSLMYFYVRDGS